MFVCNGIALLIYAIGAGRGVSAMWRVTKFSGVETEAE